MTLSVFPIIFTDVDKVNSKKQRNHYRWPSRLPEVGSLGYPDLDACPFTWMYFSTTYCGGTVVMKKTTASLTKLVLSFR